MKIFTLLIFIVSLTQSLALLADDQRPMSGTIDTPKGHYAFGPYINYDSTYLWTFGAAIIKESEDKSIDTFHLDFEGSTKGYEEVDFAYHRMLTPTLSGNFEIDFDTFFEPFYGTGISTKTEDKKLIDQRHLQIIFTPLHEFSHSLAAGPIVEFQSRLERPERQNDKKRYYPNEQSGTIGAQLLYDTRDSKLDPIKGENIELTFLVLPEFLTNLDHQSSFSQIKLDCRNYTPIYKTVLASRFAIGETLGQPSFLYTYRLGGPNYMRGFEVNRFIGNQFAVVQLEDRIKLYKEFLTGTVSYEVGSVTSKLYDKRRSNTGIGFRVAMPPDWKDKLSVNFGYGDDQSNIEMEFNENF